MKRCVKVILWMTAGIVMPYLSEAQSSNAATNIKSLHHVLDQLYDEMLPLCSQLIDVGRSIAGFAAMWYIAVRVWRHLANAEPIDFYPLFRPFVLGFMILVFPSVIAMINDVLKPTVNATSAMVENSNQAIAELLKKKEEAIRQTDLWQMYVGAEGIGDRDKWYKYTHPDDSNGNGEGLLAGIGNDIKFAMSQASYKIRSSIKQVISEVLELLFQAAALCINTMRTFNLVVLAILGPLVFGLSVFDGFQHTLKHWLARYVNVFLWLPVANLFGAIIGKVQERMLQVDISEVQGYGDTFFSSTDTGYLIFMIIGIIGYFTVPQVASYIMFVGGGDALTAKTSAIAGMAAESAVSTGMGAAGGVAGGAVNVMNSGVQKIWDTTANGKEFDQASSHHGVQGRTGEASGNKDRYMRDKLSGNS